MQHIKSVDYIITAKHYGNGSARGYIRKMQQSIHQRGIAVTIKDIDKAPTGTPVRARIWQGQWIADCECNGASFVDPDEPIFFCFSCGNRAHGQRPRPVEFPPEAKRKEIERLLLERPVNDMAGLTDLERAGMAKPVLYAQIEIDEPPSMEQVMGSLREGQPILEPNKRVVTVPLVRSWEPGQSAADLHAEQDDAIKKWHEELNTK